VRITDIVGLAGSALVLAALAAAAGRGASLRRPWLALLGAAVAAVALIPLWPLPLAGALRGITGDLSVTTLVLLSRFVLRPVFDWEPLEARTARALRGLVAAGGVLLYPLTLGLGLWDPYTLGYGEPWFLGFLAALAAATLVLDLPFVTGCLAMGVLAWSVGSLESRNLWDYLIDPLLFAWGLSTLLLGGAKALRLRNRAESSS
jgi:hypothetical protein